MNLFSKPASGPYKNEGFNAIYNLLFCDDIELYKAKHSSPAIYPWDDLFAREIDTMKMQEIMHDETLETRSKILAGNLLLKKGIIPPQKDLLAVVVEVGLENGLDVVAAYKDGNARYINHSEKMIIWETKTDHSAALINQLFFEGEKIINQIGPWDKPRRPAPGKDMVRINFLVSDGLYFGEGPFDFLSRDQMGGPIIAAAEALMTFLIDQQIGRNN